MVKIADLGFSQNEILETIVTTFNNEGQPNAAPMGVLLEKRSRLSIKPYKSTSTFKNLNLKRCAVINVTSNPELYFRTTFKENNKENSSLQNYFQNAMAVDAPILKKADANIEVVVEEINNLDESRAEAICRIETIKAQPILPQAYCRASAATIEAIIHTTRVKEFSQNPDKKEYVKKLLDTIKTCNEVVERVAPKSNYAKIMANLYRMIDSWKLKT